MEDNFANSTTNISGDQGCPSYLPSVKRWNQHIRRSTFVKDHTAVPLPNLQRDHSWNAHEHTYSSHNSSNLSEFNQLPTSAQGTPQIAPTSPESTSLKKAFEMASRTRDILNKLDGWKALSIKPYPTSSQCTVASAAGYTIKSSSQFTTLDANSSEAKDILKNIKDMAQILCPSEYGGVSHFRVMQDAGQDVEVPIKSTDLVDRNNFVLNKPMDGTVSNVSTLLQGNSSISSSRINIIGKASNSSARYPGSHLGLDDNGTNIIGSSLMNNSLDASTKTDSVHKTSHGLGSSTANESQRPSFDKVKALYEDLMSKLNQKSQENADVYAKPPEGIASDSLYEDFDDVSFTSMTGQPLAGTNGHQPSFGTLYSYPTVVDENVRREKDHHEWERETQDFLRKLNEKSEGARREERASVDVGHRRSVEMPESRAASSSRERFRTDRGRLLAHVGSSERSSSSLSSVFARRSGSVNLCGFGDRGDGKSMGHENSKTSNKSESKFYKSMDPVGSKHSTAGRSGEFSKKMMFYDDSSHACEDCGLSWMSLPSYLEHLLTKEHIKNMKNMPSTWTNKFDVNLLSKQNTERCLPVRGSEFICPVTEGFYCKPCKKYFHNKDKILFHLISQAHDQECYYYKSPKKRSGEFSNVVPAKKSRTDYKDDAAKPIAAVSPKGGEVTKTIPISTGSKASMISSGSEVSTISTGSKVSTISSGSKVSTMSAGSKVSTISTGSKVSTISANATDVQSKMPLPGKKGPSVQMSLKSASGGKTFKNPGPKSCTPKDSKLLSTSKEKMTERARAPAISSTTDSTIPKNVEITVIDDVESESDFLELDEWVEVDRS